GIAAALAAGLAVGWLLHRPVQAPTRSDRWTVPMPTGTTYSTAEMRQLAISPDGKLQAAVVVDAQGVRHLSVHGGDEFEARILAGTENAEMPFLSPDGAWVGFFRAAGLYKVPIAGGPPVQVAEVKANRRGGTWSRDGFIYFPVDAQSGLSRV